MLGKQVIFVDPWGTTQFCHSCLQWVPKNLGEREHDCPKCGIKLSRDLNSAKLIRRLGIQKRSPPSDGESSSAELLPLPSLRRMASIGEEAGGLRMKRLCENYLKANTLADRPIYEYALMHERE